MRISSGTLVLGIFAVLFGLVAAQGAKQYFAEKPAPETPAAAPKAERPVQVPMASIDLPAGRTVAFGDIMIYSMTPKQMQERGLPAQIMIDSSQVIGRTLRAEIKKGSPFLTDELYPQGSGPSVAERLQPGYRAVTVPLDNSEAEMSLLIPGDLADVVFRTFAMKDSALPETTVTLLENVEILAIGSQAFPGGKAETTAARSRGTTSVTLACTPDQASALKVVQDKGSLSLVLRGPEDDQLVGTSPPRTLESLLELPEPQPPVTTQIFRRGQLTTAVFEEG
ncbi:MAG: Flp pilus assembly protein CpaB, partial [Thermoguttaceae bacterium]